MAPRRSHLAAAPELVQSVFPVVWSEQLPKGVWAARRATSVERENSSVESTHSLAELCRFTTDIR